MLDASGPKARDYHTMAYDIFRENTILFGGTNVTVNLGDTWVWDGLNWLRLFPTHSPTARVNHAVVYEENQGITLL